jgi:hypothetical protein
MNAQQTPHTRGPRPHSMRLLSSPGRRAFPCTTRCAWLRARRPLTRGLSERDPGLVKGARRAAVRRPSREITIPRGIVIPLLPPSSLPPLDHGWCPAPGRQVIESITRLRDRSIIEESSSVIGLVKATRRAYGRDPRGLSSGTMRVRANTPRKQCGRDLTFYYRGSSGGAPRSSHAPPRVYRSRKPRRP